MYSFVLPLILLLGSVATPVKTDPAKAGLLGAGIEGHWMTENQRAVVEIAACEGETYCGHLRWVNPENPAVITDRKNKDKTKRDTPLVGLKVLWGLRIKDGRFVDGKIYNVEDGNTYASRIKPVAGGKVQAEGCFLVVCQKQVLTRYEGNLPPNFAD